MYPGYGGSNQGMYAQGVRIFRRFPLGCPVLLLVVAVLGLALSSPLFAGHNFYVLPFAVFALLTIAGITLFRSGLDRWRLKRTPIVLVCPRCSLQSAWSDRPFKVTKWYDVDYAMVVCPSCGEEFQVDGDRPLI